MPASSLITDGLDVAAAMFPDCATAGGRRDGHSDMRDATMPSAMLMSRSTAQTQRSFTTRSPDNSGEQSPMAKPSRASGSHPPETSQP